MSVTRKARRAAQRLVPKESTQEEMNSFLRSHSGWRMQLSEYHYELFMEMPELATDIMTRAYYRAMRFTSNAQLEGIAFAWEPSPDDATGLAHRERFGKDADTIESIVIGVFSALEILSEQPSKVVTA